MNRRAFFCAMTAAFLLPSLPAFARKEFHWHKPGARPYAGSADDALKAFADLVPKKTLARLRHLVQAGKGVKTTIPNGFRFARMLFGKGRKVSNVVADTDAWPKEASRGAVMYQVQEGNRVYALFRPDICGNWALSIVHIQGTCIPDTARK